MFKIDTPAATPANLFTEGDPETSVPATEVSDEWLNEVQEEIVKVVEEVGIALVKGSQNQLNLAILEYFLRGGRKTPLQIALANNTADIDLTGFVMNKTTSVAKVGFYSVERKTTTNLFNEVGIIFTTYDSKNDQWLHEAFSVLDDSGVTFNINNADTDAAQLRASTDDVTGASYVGNITIAQIFELRV